jgi:microcystin-dependent protein
VIKRQFFLVGSVGALLTGCAGGASALGPPPRAASNASRPRLRTPQQTIGYLGEILLVPYEFVPEGWAACDGSPLPINDFQKLFSLIGTKFGGDGKTSFGLPDLREHAPLKGLQYIIGLYGELPSNPDGDLRLLGELMLAPYDATPPGWLVCDGAELKIDDHTVLFALLGGAFGLSASTFNLPDLRKHVPVAGLKYLISLNGMFPTRSYGKDGDGPMIDVYVAEMILLPYYTPEGFLPCDCQILPINSSAPYRQVGDHVLYEFLHDRFGGNCMTTFALPDMKGHEPIDGLNYVIALPGVFPPRS